MNMKKSNLVIIFLLFLLLSILGCKQKTEQHKFYKNFYTGRILNQTEFNHFGKELKLKYNDSTKRFKLNYLFFKIDKSVDSIIYNFKYSLRVGNEYIVNSSKAKIFEFVNREFLIKNFKTINGDSIQIGGINDKPTLINFWFTRCSPCIAEMPILNKIKEKYSDRVNFVSVTWQNKKDVLKFLKKNEFNFTHISDAKKFIDYIEIEGYPKNIFIDKKGILKYIENGIPTDSSGKITDGKEFESIIEELL
jgi:thiol-disulfide isomerase/thioredoxin